MGRIIEVDVEELWRNTFDDKILVPLHVPFLGSRHLATARMLMDNPETPVTKLPLYQYILSPEYSAAVGRRVEHKLCVAYLERYKQVFKNIKAKGYVRQFGLISVRIKDDGTVILDDGRRRLTSVLVIGKQNKIQVEVVQRPK